MAADVLLNALAVQAPATHAHAREVAALAAAVARALGLDRRSRENVARAAELHDIGKLAIPAEILAKAGPLEPVEHALLRRHTVVGEAMIGAAPPLRPVALLVRASHERWDGRGYPDGLEGEEIPIGARVIAVCDTYDAITSKRSYADAQSHEEALVELQRCAGTQFDPVAVNAFCAVNPVALAAAPVASA
jgi:two-component system cell cycle response regulator